MSDNGNNEVFPAGEVNIYSSIKSAAEGILDVTVVSANFSILRLAEDKVDNTAMTSSTFALEHHSLLRALAITSLTVNCLSAVILVVVFALKYDATNESQRSRLKYVNTFVLLLAITSLVLNSAIAAYSDVDDAA